MIAVEKLGVDQSPFCRDSTTLCILCELFGSLSEGVHVEAACIHDAIVQI